MRGIGVPDQQSLAIGTPPPERPRQLLAANPEWHRPTGVVVRDGEVANVRFGQQSQQPDHRARHIRLKRRHDLDSVLVPQPLRVLQPPGKLIDRIRLGVHAERQGRDLHAPVFDLPEELIAERCRAIRHPLLQRIGHLDVPTELRLVRPIVGRVDQIDRRIDEAQMVVHHARLLVGIAVVEMRMMDEMNVPLALRLDHDWRAHVFAVGRRA